MALTHIVTSLLYNMYTLLFDACICVDEDISISPELLLPYQVVSDIAAQTCMLRHQAVVHKVHNIIMICTNAVVTCGHSKGAVE